MRTKVLALGLVCIFLLSCTFTSHVQLIPEEQDYLNKVMQTPLRFIVPRNQAIEIWLRMQEFVIRYRSIKSLMAINSPTSIPYIYQVVETYRSVGIRINCDYAVDKSLVDNEIVFEVICFCGDSLRGEIFANRMLIFLLTTL